MFNWLYWIFGKILFGIDWFTYHVFGIHNIGLCVILFTIIVYLLMYPLNAKQQKSTRLMSKINPELQEIQKKYKNKRDQASQMKMNEETQALYAKYGISPFGGCLPLLISFPIMICLYRVIYSMGNYVEALNSPSASYFLGLDMKATPMAFFKDPNHPYGWLAFLVPILAMVLQFVNTKVIQSNNNSNSNQDQMQQSMKMMNYFMPLMSGFFCLSLNMGIGLYWITGSLFRIIQAIIVNRKIDQISMEELIEKNKEKAAKKNEKRKKMNLQMEEYAKTRTASIKSATSYKNQSQDDNTESSNNVDINKDFEPGSIAGYANMLSRKDKNGGK